MGLTHWPPAQGNANPSDITEWSTEGSTGFIITMHIAKAYSEKKQEFRVLYKNVAL